MDAGKTGWLVDGFDLRRLGYNIRSNAGWDGFPGTKIARHTYGFKHGDRLGAKGFYDPKQFTLAMEVLPTAADGSVTLEPEAHIQANIDALLGLFHAPDRMVTVTKTFGVGPTSREAECAVLTPFLLGSGTGRMARTFAVSFEMVYPFWHELPIVNLSSPASLTNNGNAPVGDAVITFNGAGRLTVDSSGDWIESDAGGVVVDCGSGNITFGGGIGDSHITMGQAWFPDFEPGVNALTLTGSIDIDYYHTYF